jgi:hypothetical protein
VDEDPDRLRRALREIEELIDEAERNGGRVDRWLRELAEELRNAVPEQQAPPSPPPVDGFRVALSMRSDPARSIGAQARLDAQALKLLKD